MQKAILEQVCVEQNLEDRKRHKPQQQQAAISHAADSDSDADSNSNLKDSKPEKLEKFEKLDYPDSEHNTVALSLGETIFGNRHPTATATKTFTATASKTAIEAATAFSDGFELEGREDFNSCDNFSEAAAMEAIGLASAMPQPHSKSRSTSNSQTVKSSSYEPIQKSRSPAKSKNTADLIKPSPPISIIS